MLKRLHLRLNEQGLIVFQNWMIDYIALRAIRASLAPEKRGPDEPADHSLGRNRGGLTIKIHMLCDANGTPLRFLLSRGQVSEISYAQPLLNEVSIPSSQRDRPRKRCKWFLPTRATTPKRSPATATIIECNPSLRCARWSANPSPAYPDCLIDRNIDRATSSNSCLAG